MTFPDGVTGTVYASTKTMNKKADYVYCQYQGDDFSYLGYYDEFLELETVDSLLDFCLENYEDRVL